LRDGTDGTLEMCSNVRQFSGGFIYLPGGDWRQRKRCPPELATVPDGMKEFISWGHLATGTGVPELWGKNLTACEATGSKSSGPAAVGPAWGVAGFI
jgi:hypothetical protein